MTNKYKWHAAQNIEMKESRRQNVYEEVRIEEFQPNIMSVNQVRTTELRGDIKLNNNISLREYCHL